VEKPRIFGTELEYGLVTDATAGGQNGNHEDIRGLINDYVGDGLAQVDGFYSNGSRIYEDVGSHIEYCTPEDDSIEGTVANEIAGERIILDGLKRAKQAGLFDNFRLNKRVMDDSGTSWGYHINLLMKRGEYSPPFDPIALGLHLATINMFTGAGMITPKLFGSPRFALAQKTFGLSHEISNNTTAGNKPLINTRDEPLANSNEYFRLHVVSNDANLSPWAMRMRLGTVALILKLGENGFSFDEFETEKPAYKLSKDVAEDLTLRQVVRLQNGRTIRPINIQEEFVQSARRLAEKVELPLEEVAIIDEWEKACVDIIDDPEKLIDRADWVAKFRILKLVKDNYRLKWGSGKLRFLDRHWDNLADGFGQRMRNKEWAKWMPSEELITKRMRTPPDTTRAILRGRFITRFAHIEDAGVNWHKVALPGRTIELPEPHQTVHDEIESMLRVA